MKPNEGTTHIGPAVDREEADRILRDAMASLGTPFGGVTQLRPASG